jgi:hypothetical protein
MQSPKREFVRASLYIEAENGVSSPLGNDLETFLITQYIFLEQYNNKDNVPGVFARGVQALNPGQAPPSAAFSPRAAGARSLPAATTQQRRRIPHDWPAEELDSVCVCRLLSSARNLDCAASTNFIQAR